MSDRISKQDEFEFSQRDMERLIARLEPRILAAFVRAVFIAQQENTLDELAELARTGQLLEVIEAAAQAGAESLADVINTAIVESGQLVAGGMTGAFNIVVSFDQVNTRLVDIMQQNRLRLVSEFTREQRAATREALLDGVRRGLNPRAQARNFRESIGLTARQQRAVNRFRELLETGSAEALRRELRDRRFDRTVERAIAGDIILSDAQIDRMVTRYRERFLKFRSEVIARTESLRSAHEGTLQAFLQAADNGKIDVESVVRTWNTAEDARVRVSHEDMNGQRQPLGEPFISGLGNQLMYPGDLRAPAADTIQCRCAVGTRVQRLPSRAAA